MRVSISAGLFLIFCALAVAQADSNSLTVTSSRPVSVPADQAVFGVYVNAPATATLDDILAVVQPVGITLANFSSVDMGTSDAYTRPLLQWSFILTGPLTDTKGTFAKLASLQSAVAKSNPNVAVSFSLQGTGTSAQAVQSQTCSMTDLLNDAKTKAQTMATAAGRFVSGILALATVAYPQAPQACSVTVKFSLVGF